MDAAQTWVQSEWLAWENPLAARFDRAFFRTIPRAPGVYRFFDDEDRVLYVGYSRSLRERVRSYGYLKPGRASRRQLRLIARIRRIAWEICADPVAARLRENALLRTLRPTFNRQNIYPDAQVYLGLAATRAALHLAWSPEPALATTPRAEIYDLPGLGGDHESDAHSLAWTWHGAFGRATTRGVLLALARLWWLAQHPGATAFDLPVTLTRERAPPIVRLAFGTWPASTVRRLQRKTHAFIAGEDDALPGRLLGLHNGRPLADGLLRRQLAADHETLLHFHRFGAARNRQFRLARASHRRRQPLGKAERDDAAAAAALQHRDERGSENE